MYPNARRSSRPGDPPVPGLRLVDRGLRPPAITLPPPAAL